MRLQKMPKKLDVSTEMKTKICGTVYLLLVGLMLVACADEEPATRLAAIDATVSGADASTTTPSPMHEPTTADVQTVLASEVWASEHANLLALSPEEAAWLARHGYPTMEEMAALLSYDMGELESAMRNRKDPKAAALLGHRRAMEGDLRGAAAAFSAGASIGSLYARQQLAIVSTQRATGLPPERLSQADQGNLGVLVAQLEVARMLGDHRAQTLIDTYTTDFDWEYYGKHVLSQTAEFMRQYGEDSRARGERPMGPDPRPNADAWGELEADPNRLVTVYKRKPSFP